MQLLVAADIDGCKKNIRFMFPTRPTLKEFSTQIELAFQKEAVEGGSTSRFRVGKLQVFIEQLQMWADVARQGQLEHGKQYFVFQGETRSRSAGGRTPRRTSSQSVVVTPKMKRIERKIRSNTPERRQTCVTSKQNHFADKRGRISRMAQAQRTAENDKRFTVFQILTSDSPDVQFLDTKLNHLTITTLLSRRGVAEDDLRTVQYLIMSMEVGPDGNSSYAQFVRFCRKYPSEANSLFDIVLSSKQIILTGEHFDSISELNAQAKSIIEHHEESEVFTPITVSPAPPLENHPNSVVAPVAPPMNLNTTTERSVLTTTQNDHNIVDEDWLARRLAVLEAEHQQKISEVKQRYALLSQTPDTSRCVSQSDHFEQSNVKYSTELRSDSNQRANQIEHPDQSSFYSNAPEHQSLSYNGYQRDDFIRTKDKEDSAIKNVYSRLASALHSHPTDKVQFP